MAVDVVIAGETYRRRSPLGVLVLTALTLFVYWVVWTYKVNDEARRFLKDDAIRPWIPVLAMVPGALLVVPPFVAVWVTGRRIRRMQEQAGTTARVKPLLGVLCTLLTTITYLFAGGTASYFQHHLDTVWDAMTPPSGDGGTGPEQATGDAGPARGGPDPRGAG